MKESSVSKNNKLPKWIDDFISTLTKTADAEEVNNDVVDVNEEIDSINNEANIESKDVEKIAEININNLPKVIWNDETYYAYIDNEGASIINGFGNVVTSLPGAETIEDVNKILNDKQIVSEKTASEELEKEIDKVLAYTNIEADINDDQQATEYIENYEQNNSNDTNGSEQTIESNKNDSINIEAMINDKFEKLSNQLTNLINTKFAEYTEQLYARNNNITNVDINANEEEVKKFNEDAISTAEQIIKENLTDKTTPEGRYSTKDSINDDVINEPIEKDSTEDLNDNPIKNLDDGSIEDVVEDITEESTENLDNEELNQEASIDTDEVELPEEEIGTFKQGVCPFCNSQLAKNGIDGNYINIICEDCGAEYKINADNEKVYLK